MFLRKKVGGVVSQWAGKSPTFRPNCGQTLFENQKIGLLCVAFLEKLDQYRLEHGFALIRH
jgi:hypothetical protein